MLFGVSVCLAVATLEAAIAPAFREVQPPFLFYLGDIKSGGLVIDAVKTLVGGHRLRRECR